MAGKRRVSFQGGEVVNGSPRPRKYIPSDPNDNRRAVENANYAREISRAEPEQRMQRLQKLEQSFQTSERDYDKMKRVRNTSNSKKSAGARIQSMFEDAFKKQLKR